MTAPICCGPVAPASATADKFAQLVVPELRRQVRVEHHALGALAFGQFGAPGGVERLGRLAPLLGLAAEHPQHFVVAELA
jgi:hypothetical protein